MPGSRRGGWIIFLISAVVTCVFLINFCAWIYQCGCRSLWAGGVSHCNIHTPGVKHCPWCILPGQGFYVIAGLILGPQGLLSFRPRRWSWRRRLVAALVAFPGCGLILALAAGWLFNYWT